ncbi:H-NS family nucleoid-associated regulatory protein [Paraburkholderia steynii]|uniref:H-NS family nucleoid-associated regulatory protein n=1 Tax=Paraburkholderia steynii TaxID=1245441 RepID=UPI003CC6BC96
MAVRTTALVAAKSSPSAAKYRDPKSGVTWTGHGRAPAWIASAKDRSKFLIDGVLEAEVPAMDKGATAGNYVRGPQAPKYRDPVSGATWSGWWPRAGVAGAREGPDGISDWGRGQRETERGNKGNGQESCCDESRC